MMVSKLTVLTVSRTERVGKPFSIRFSQTWNIVSYFAPGVLVLSICFDLVKDLLDVVFKIFISRYH